MIVRRLIVSDTFTEPTADTDLPSHTPDTGTSWTETGTGMSGNATLTVRFVTDRLEEQNYSDGNRALAAPTSGTADMDVEADLTYVASRTDIQGGLLARWDPATGQRNEIYFEPNTGTYGTYRIEDTNAATSNTHTLTAGEAWSTGTSRLFLVECRGTTSYLYVDGVLKVTHTAPNNVTGMKGGVVGINFSGAGGAWAWDNFKVYEVAAVAPPLIISQAVMRATNY